jgi:hypothetical protein
MTTITLYTHERKGAGLTSTDMCRVKGAVRLKVVSAGETWEYPTKGIGPATMNHEKFGPAAGEADLRLRIAEEDVDLAKCKGAVALSISGSSGTKIYWIEAGVCSEVEYLSFEGFACARIEARCCPDEYELPPQIT